MIDVQAIVRQLAANAETIRALVQAVPVEQAQWQPNPETWSIAQVMEHLYNEERIDFRQHLKEMLHDPPQAWGAFQEPYLPVESCRQALDAFWAERQASLAWLEALEAPDWDVQLQASFGPSNETIAIRAGDVLVSWLDHDFAHLRQVLRLLHAWHAREAAPYSTDYAGGSW